MTQTKPINFGVIGTGRIGRLHAEHLAYRIPNTHLSALADVNLQSAQECGARLGVSQVHQDAHRILTNDEINAVAICSSTDTHAQLIEDAAAAGKHIFCEKPIDFDLARIDRALQAVETAGVQLQIGFNRRFDPNFFEVRRQVEAGTIGDPHLIRISSRDPAPPPIEYVKVSGGLFLDMMIHDFDMARYLAGDEIISVYAEGGVLVDPQIGEAGDIDTAAVTLRFKNGAIGTIDNSRQAVYGYDQRVEVFGSKGMVAADNNAPTRTSISDKEGIHAPLPYNFFMERYIDSYIIEMKAFVDAIVKWNASTRAGPRWPRGCSHRFSRKTIIG